MELIKPNLSQLDILNRYLKGSSIKDCGFCTGNAILWAEEYHVSYVILSEMLVFIAEENGKPSSFTFPIGIGTDFIKDIQNPDYLLNARSVFDEVCTYFHAQGVTPCVHCATPEIYEIITGWYGKEFPYTLDPGDFDYIYTVEKLTYLRGKKLHGKRNHINNFMRNYPDYEYYTITDEHIDACLAIARYWVEKHDVLQPELAEEHAYEYNIIRKALSNRRKMQMTGGIIYVNHIPSAFTLGEPLTNDTFDVHFEKADDSIDGIYPMINKTFVANELQNYTYVNREEDLGLPGLRKSKMSYVPDILYKKGIITLTGLYD